MDTENIDTALVGPLGNYERSKPYHVSINGEDILLVYRNDAWCAFSMRCPHKGAMMRVEDLKNNILACPFHAWYFDIEDNGRELHNYVGLTEYETRVIADNLYIDII